MKACNAPVASQRCFATSPLVCRRASPFTIRYMLLEPQCAPDLQYRLIIHTLCFYRAPSRTIVRVRAENEVEKAGEKVGQAVRDFPAPLHTFIHNIAMLSMESVLACSKILQMKRLGLCEIDSLKQKHQYRVPLLKS